MRSVAVVLIRTVLLSRLHRRRLRSSAAAAPIQQSQQRGTGDCGVGHQLVAGLRRGAVAFARCKGGMGADRASLPRSQSPSCTRHRRSNAIAVRAGATERRGRSERRIASSAPLPPPPTAPHHGAATLRKIEKKINLMRNHKRRSGCGRCKATGGRFASRTHWLPKRLRASCDRRARRATFVCTAVVIVVAYELDEENIL
jgi:hypothetical protein